MHAKAQQIKRQSHLSTKCIPCSLLLYQYTAGTFLPTLPTENWKGAPSQGLASPNCALDQHKCLLLDESTSIIYLIPPKEGYSVFTSKSISDTLMGAMICPKYMQPFFMLMQKNLKVIKSLLLTAPAVTIRQLMRRKTAPTALFPELQPSFRKNAVTNDTFHLPTMPLSDYRFRWITWLQELGPGAHDCLWHPPYAIRVKFSRAKWNNCNRVSLSLQVNL